MMVLLVVFTKLNVKTKIQLKYMILEKNNYHLQSLKECSTIKHILLSNTYLFNA